MTDTHNAPADPELEDSVPVADAGPSHIRMQVASSDQGLRLDKFLANQPHDISRSRIKSLAADGKLTVDGVVITSLSKPVKAGQVAVLSLPPTAPAEPQAENIDLDIAYEDDDLIVVNKPAGMVVHPAAGSQTGTLVNALLYHCGSSLSGIGGVARPGIVHRIDKDTSGLLVVAKSDKAHQGLATQFEAHTIDRIYRALCFGRPKQAKGRIEGAIGRHPVDRKKMALVEDGRGKHAVTHFSVQRSFHLDGAVFASEIKCKLETGRTHQVRVHMASINNPLIGDPVYTKRRKIDSARYPTLASAYSGFTRQALHAESLGFTHPLSGETLNFSADLPYDMDVLLRAIEATAIEG